jgi:hypothetical protein
MAVGHDHATAVRPTRRALLRRPLVGDALTVVAGVMREPFQVFVLLVAVAKTAR